MKISFIFTFLATIILFNSCKEELVMIPEFKTPESDRKVLLEELTGVRCPNCPAGAAVVKDLKAKYGDLLIPIGIHGGFLTIPLAESKYDFQNDYARELETFLEVGPKPAAALNRVQHIESEFSISTPGLWSQYIDDELAKPSVMTLLMTHTYDELTRTIDLIVTVIPLQDFAAEENVRLSMMVIQNDIEDPQEDPNDVIEDYVHEHVLRTMLTDAKGDIIQEALVKDQPLQYNFSFTLPADADLEEMEAPWVPEHVEVVAFLNVIKDDAKHILQAEFVHIGE